MPLSFQKFQNIPEYSKIGLGLYATVAGLHYALRFVNTRRAAEEVLYRGIDSPTPEKLVAAYYNFNKYVKDNANPTEADKASFALIIGPALLASGIWNLVRNYKREQQN